MINPNVAASCKNLRSHHDLDLGSVQQRLPVAPAAIAGRTAVGSELGRHQFVRSHTHTQQRGKGQLQAGSASNPGGGTNSPPGDLKTRIDRPDCRRGVERQADQRASHRTAGRLPGRVRWRPGWFKRHRCDRGCRCRRPPRGRLLAADQAARMAPITVIMAAMAVRPRPPVSPRTGSTGSSSDTSSADDILQQFLQSLQDSLSSSSQNSYSATGSAASDSASSFSALLINYQT